MASEALSPPRAARQPDSRGTPLVLMYHSVGSCTADPYRLTVSPRRFAEQMRWIRDTGRRGVPIVRLLEARRQGHGRDLVGLTFDDGYADFDLVARPVLEEFGFTATVFVVAGQFGGHNSWDCDAPRKQLLSRQQVGELAGSGMEIGSHGSTHRRLVGLTEHTLDLEVVRSREALEQVIQRPVHGFCYPYGRYDHASVRAVRESGYRYAAGVEHTPDSDRWTIPRSYVGERDTAWRLRAKELRHRLRTAANGSRC